ncbi:MAG: MarR family transcriptional regulator [Rhodobacteraceae bacterium]|nr:MAG: MarR family transcriptional regulator [Paracoccaceae bacterium]
MPGHLIRRLQQIASSIFAQQMKSHGTDLTSPQFAALAMIHDHPRIDQATLAGAIAFDRATIGGVVDRLVSKGLVARTTNPKDRRARVLILTEDGEAMLTRLRPIVADCQDAILSSLTAAETREFIRLATKIATSENEQSRAPLHEVRPSEARSA